MALEENTFPSKVQESTDAITKGIVSTFNENFSSNVDRFAHSVKQVEILDSNNDRNVFLEQLAREIALTYFGLMIINGIQDKLQRSATENVKSYMTMVML